MSSAIGSLPFENKSKETSHKRNNFQSVVGQLPKEIKIIGKFSEVYVDGVSSFSNHITDKTHLYVPESDWKSTKKKYIIIPVKSEKSSVQFIKVPIFKLSKNPRAIKIGNIRCKTINISDEVQDGKFLVKWETDRKELKIQQPQNYLKNDSKTCFIFQQNNFQSPEKKKTPQFEDSSKLTSTVEEKKVNKNDSKMNIQNNPTFVPEREKDFKNSETSIMSTTSSALEKNLPLINPTTSKETRKSEPKIEHETKNPNARTLPFLITINLQKNK